MSLALKKIVGEYNHQKYYEKEMEKSKWVDTVVWIDFGVDSDIIDSMGQQLQNKLKILVGLPLQAAIII